jgi:hypothetical protein
MLKINWAFKCKDYGHKFLLFLVLLSVTAFAGPMVDDDKNLEFITISKSQFDQMQGLIADQNKVLTEIVEMHLKLRDEIRVLKNGTGCS